MANVVMGFLGAYKQSIRHLDYGGGSGKLSEILRDNKWNSSTFEVFGKKDVVEGKKFDLITCFEVFEHVPNPNALIINLKSLLDHPGMVIFSTGLNTG